MCGICALVGPEPIDQRRLRAMTRSLAHRGPDGEGVYVDGGVGLGHRRLSIIDLDGGRQPMASGDGTLWITFNGEIYNYRVLRQQLIRQGCHFRTQSDTEVILHLYQLYGADCLRHLRGMFALAIWDSRRQQLFAARDRLGQKPLFYSQQGQYLRLASEIKALLVADPALGAMDLEGLDEYLTLRLVAPPRTMFQGVHKLPPAHYLLFDGQSGLRIQRYWDLSYEPKVAGTDEALVDELEHRLVECLRLHMESDVPVGAFLSGGLDSTILVALLRKHQLAERLPTFSVGLPYRRFNEAPAARVVAEQWRTEHHEEIIRPSLLAQTPLLLAQMDEPSDPLSICMSLIARFARRHVKVVLGGDGGDELFGGYDRYYGQRYAQLYAQLPESLRRRLFEPLIHRLPEGGWYKSWGHQLKWLQQMSFFDGGQRYVQSLSYFYFGQPWKQTLYGPVMQRGLIQAQPGAAIENCFNAAPAKDLIDRMLYADCQIRLPDHSVMILDRMTMAQGLEARSPLMDHELMEFMARLPVHVKIRGRRLRYLQVELARRLLPAEVLARKKQGFASAIPYVLKHELETLYRHFLTDTRLGRDGILRQATIDSLLTQHRAGKVDHGHRLWLLVSSEMWYRLFALGNSAEELSSELTERHAAAA